MNDVTATPYRLQAIRKFFIKRFGNIPVRLQRACKFCLVILCQARGESLLDLFIITRRLTLQAKTSDDIEDTLINGYVRS